MEKESEGRRIHAKALDALEHKQDLVLALALVEEATVCYIDNDDLQGASEVQGVRMIIFKRKHRQTQKAAYLKLMLQAGSDAVNIAKATGNEQNWAIPSRDLGKALLELERYQEATGPLTESLRILVVNPPERFDWDAVRAEVKAHLGFAQYMSGNKDQGRANLMEAIETLKKEKRSYEVDVWLSGAYMKGAAMLHPYEPETSKKFMGLAKDIIDSNEKLGLRKEDWEELNKKLS